MHVRRWACSRWAAHAELPADITSSRGHLPSVTRLLRRRGDKFTMSSTNLTCDACPTGYALCNYVGKSDETVPVGAVAAPLDGYWHSSPYSPQFHACPVPAACSGDSWRNSRTELVQYQKDLVYGNRTLNLTEYNLLQCKEGYWGECSCVCVSCATAVCRSVLTVLLCHLSPSPSTAGNLCGGCVEGYGRQSTGQCAKVSGVQSCEAQRSVSGA